MARAKSRPAIREAWVIASRYVVLAPAGAVVGGLAIGIEVAVLRGLGALSGPSAGGRPDVAVALAAALYFWLVAAVQEGVFRGWLLSALSGRVGFWRAATVTSLAFASIHVFIQSQSAVGMVAMAVFGLAMCAAVRRFGTLGWATGFHAGWDFCLTALCGFGAAPGQNVLWRFAPKGPVWLSGGRAGPEASAAALVVLSALFMSLAWRAAKTRH